jgi:hypothetical protein
MATSVDWIKHIESWRSSGLSQAAYCRQRGLNYRTFTVRLSAYRKNRKETHASRPATTALIPIQVRAPLSTGTIRLTTERGHRVDLPTSITAVWLAELLRCLD